MVARSLPPQAALPGKAAPALRHPRRRTRTPLLHPAPSLNPVAGVLEEALELGMLAGDAGPLPHTPDCRPLAGDATSQAGGARRPQEKRSEDFVPASCSAEDLKRTAVAMAMEEVEVPVPTEKLSTDPNLDGGRRGGVVLVATRSFNPPTYMHRHSLQRMSCSSEGSRWWVDSGYMSPVNDANKKKAMQKGYQRTLTILSRVKNSLCKDGLADQGSVKVMLLCGSHLLESSASQGFGFQIRSKEEVEPEEVLGRITTVCGRLVQGTRQARVPMQGGRVRGGAGAGAGAGRARRRGCQGRLYLLGTGDLAGRMRGCRGRLLSPRHWRSRMTDATLRAVTIGDGDRAGRRSRRAGRRRCWWVACWWVASGTRSRAWSFLSLRSDLRDCRGRGSGSSSTLLVEYGQSLEIAKCTP